MVIGFGCELRKDDCNWLNLFLLEAVYLAISIILFFFATIFNNKCLKWIFFRVKILTMVRKKKYGIGSIEGRQKIDEIK